MTAEKKSWGAKSAELWGVIPGSADFKHSDPEVVWALGQGTRGSPSTCFPVMHPSVPSALLPVPVSGQCPARDEREGDAGTARELSNDMALPEII